jgi:beta-N-acetylhexosaminidase
LAGHRHRPEAQQQGLWRASGLSETRRLALLPQLAPLPWDELMHAGVYRHALDRLP